MDKATRIMDKLTTKQAAKILGYSDSSRIRQLCLSGKLKAEKVGRDWMVDKNSVYERISGFKEEEMKTDYLELAESLGREFALELNANPIEGRDWEPLTRDDPIPSEDYVSLREHSGVVTEDMEAAYRRAFNATLSHLG